jgi:potassium efflux system protein
MASFLESHPMILRQSLFALIAMTLVAPAYAQLTLPKQLSGLLQPAPATQAAAGDEASDGRAHAEALLAEARRQQQEQVQKERGSAAEGLPTSERQRLLDRLVLFYSDRLKLFDELDTLQHSPPETANQRTLMADLAGPPPYSALQVDALRDEHDTLSAQLKSLTASARALEAQQAGLVEVRKRASEALRLAADRRNQTDKDRDKHELAALRLQEAEADVTANGLALDFMNLKLKKLQPLAEQMRRLLSRVLPEQKLAKEELEQQQARARGELAKVSTEIDQLTAENNKLTAEHERLAKLLPGADPDGPIAYRMQVLAEQMETNRLRLMTLTWLHGLIQIASDAWRQRFVGYSSDDTAARQAVLVALKRTSDELTSRRDLFNELQNGARVAVRQQALRLDNPLLSSSARAQEAAILEALEKRVQAYERLEVAGSRLYRQLNRWLADFGFSGEAGDASNWKLGALQVKQVLKEIWDFEMFAVEDSTVVDGKTVTVAYGVTVGKSIGAIALYIVGYWLFSLLSARMQRLMVSRFHVDEQVAGVIRRWAMITLAIVLIIFILNLARIPLTVFAFMGGALAIGVGFGTQTIIKNVISGIIILFERKIRVGDIISLAGTTGYVTQVDLRASTVLGFDGIEALVPNSSLLENQVVNWTHSDARIRREIRVRIAYGSPVHGAADIILGCADDHGEVLRNPKPEVFLEDFGNNELLLVLLFWVELGPKLFGRRVDSDLRFAMEKRLGAAGIRIPFPQHDVHLDVSQPLPVRITPAPPATD